ncbi:hypothetical protein NDU88_003026 [Pleurodeles waltl]|uniref:Secreted protein n=1 Tax=Pleurodeles waltl TaxID=8319 RepID=A0AAV7NFI3_PLEWA|nr:hypothetical protein NDU88_003026 [Pleurodeles waltl]
MGGLGLLASTRGPVRRGSAAHLVLSFLVGVSPAPRSQGSAAGVRPRLPRGSRRSLYSSRSSSVRPSPDLSPVGRIALRPPSSFPFPGSAGSSRERGV